MSETDLVRSILRALELRGVWAWRMNSGTLPAVGKRGVEYRVRLAPAGTPDILAVVGGRLIGLEVKTTKARQRPSQSAWQAKAEQHGAGYRVVRSAREALEFIREIEGL